MHDPHLTILTEKAKERRAWPGAPLDSNSLRVWQDGDLDRLGSFTAQADQLLATADGQLRQLASDTDHADGWKRREREKVLAVVRDRLAKLEQDAAAITAEVEDLTQRAPRLTTDATTGNFVERPTPAPDPVAELKARETRDLLRQMDESQREQLVLGAVHDGDHATLDAVLGAPVGFPVLGPDALARVQQAQLARSPAFAHVLSGRQLASFASMVLTHTRSRVADLETYGPRAATPTDDPFAWSGPSAA